MYCIYCGTENDDECNFCLKCGKKLPKRNSSSNKFEFVIQQENSDNGISSLDKVMGYTTSKNEKKRSFRGVIPVILVVVIIIGIGVIFINRLKSRNSDQVSENGQSNIPAFSQDEIDTESIYREKDTIVPISLMGTPVPMPNQVISIENASQVVELARWGKGSCQDAIFSPNGNYIILYCSLGISLYDSMTFEEVYRFDSDRDHEIVTYAISTDGSQLAIGYNDRVIELFNIDRKELLMVIDEQNEQLSDLVFSPDGSILFSDSSDGAIYLWNTSDGSLKYRLENQTVFKNFIDAVFSPDGSKMTLSSTESNIVQLWDVESGQLLHTLNGHTDTIWDIKFSPDGVFLATGSDDRKVCLWNTESGQLLYSLDHTHSIGDIAFSADGRLLVTSSISDPNIYLWNVDNGSLDGILEGNVTGTYDDFIFSPDGQSLITSFLSDGSIHIWNFTNRTQLFTLHPNEKAEVISISPDGQMLISLSWSDSIINIWDVHTGTLKHTIEGYCGDVSGVQISPDGTKVLSTIDYSKDKMIDVASGTVLYTLDGDFYDFSPVGDVIAGIVRGEIHLWNVNNGELLYRLKSSTDFGFGQIIFSNDGETFITTSDQDYGVVLWDTESGQELWAFYEIENKIRHLVFTADEKIVSSDEKCKISIWNAKNGELLQTIEGNTNEILSIAISPDERYLAFGANDDTIRLYDIASGKLIFSLIGSEQDPTELVFSPDGQVLASAFSSGSKIYLWNVGNGGLSNILEYAGGSTLHQLAFLPDGKILASKRGKYIYLWDVEKASLLKALDEHVWYQLHSMDISKNGMFLASGSDDGTLRLWGIKP